MKGLSKAYDIGKTVVDSYRKAQELLNTTNPLGWAVIGISALVGVSKALESLPSPTEKVREEFAKLSDEEQELYDSVKKLKKSHDEWKESSDKVLDNSKSEFDYYHELADELDTIVDKNGVVKAGYEDRAKVITGELSDALGIEIEMTDGVIENYDELSDKIQDVLLLQEAQAAIDADMDSYMQAVTLGVSDISKISQINNWLQGEGELILSDDATKRYQAYVASAITPSRLSRRFCTIPIVFTCEPFRYSVFNPMETENPELDDDNLKYDTSVYVNGAAECEPLIHLKFAGKLQITVNGKLPFFVSTEGGDWSTEVFDSTASEKIYKYKCKEQEIYIDSMSRIAYTPQKKVVTLQTVGMFPVLKHGDNDISLELVSETLMFGQLKYKRCNQNLTVFGLQKNERWY